MAWFHGEKGAQKVQPLEKWSLAGVATVALVSVWLVYRGAAPVVPEEGGPAPSSIAVLYFEDLSPDGSLEYVAAGLTEGLIDKLSRVPGLSVVSRNGMARYRGTDIRVTASRARSTPEAWWPAASSECVKGYESPFGWWTDSVAPVGG